MSKIIALLASPSDGERASAAQHATELLRRNGLGWEDVVAAIPLAEEVAERDPELFVLDDLALARSELAVSEAMRNQLEDELDVARTRLSEV